MMFFYQRKIYECGPPVISSVFNFSGAMQAKDLKPFVKAMHRKAGTILLCAYFK